uniref:Insulin-like peptide 1 n=1 Tax=Laodelphax striatellus TaxID=195883 RepID=A0A345BEE0_LAOST|nr:insulin-like peptide 1 [Laodelphax striatellus]
MLTATLLVFAITLCADIISATPSLGHLNRDLYASDDIIINKCGDSLFNLMTLLCKHSDAVVKKSDSGELVWLEEEKWVHLEEDNMDSIKGKHEPETDRVPARIPKRSRRGVVYECCMQSCTLTNLMTYCVNTSK